MKNNRELEHIFEYKDTERYWWKIHLYKIDEHPINAFEGDDSVDFEWRYDLTKKNGGKWHDIHSGFIIGQYDIVPTIDDLMEEFIANMGRVSIGFSLYGVEIK